MRSARFLLAGLAGSIALAAWWRAEGEATDEVRAAAATADVARDAASPRAYDELQAELAALLGAWRRGEDGVDRARLAGLADELARDHDRADAPRVADHYLSLSPSERRAGLDDEAEWAALWRATKAADPATWPTERERVLRELRALADRVLPRADDLPAALALSLAARIEVRALEAGGVGAVERTERLARAERDARRALAICERAGSASRALEPRWTLARVDRLRGDAAAAEVRYARLGEEARRLRNDDFLEYALVARVDLARERGDVRGVDALLAELATVRRPEECWALAREAAQRLIDEDLPDRAEEFLLRTRPADAAALVGWRALLALAQLRQGETSRARAQLAELPPDEPEARLIRGQLLLAEDRPWEVVALWQDGLGDASLDPLSRVVAATQLGEAWLAEGETQRAAEVLDRTLADAADWEARLARDRRLAGGAGTVAGEWLGLHAVVLCAEAHRRMGDDAAALARVESWHARGWRGGALSADDLAAWSRVAEHGLLSLSAGADRGLAVHLDPDGALESMELPHPRRAWRAGVRRLREAAQRDDEAEVRRLGAELARQAFPPGLLERLARGDADDRLLLLAHGPLEALPFELLTLPDGRWLDEVVSVHYLPGLPAPRPGAPATTRGAWQLLGDPRGADGRALFPAARGELEAVLAMRPDASLARAGDFTADAVLDALASPRPVHLATHLGDASACADPRFAPLGLALDAGAELCVGTVAASPLAAPLVVLSTCESAGGRALDAEGLQGLSRALLEGGVRDLLVSPWPVRDRVAAEWTPAFHAELLDGASPARAARRARAALRDAGHPVSAWAGFRLLGRDGERPAERAGDAPAPGTSAAAGR